MLGFEDCSAKMQNISSAELSLAKPYIKQHEVLAPKAWSFYSFDISPEDYQVVVNVATEVDDQNSTCACNLAPFVDIKQENLFAFLR